MGMSASQCRLLSLTSRMSDLEYEAQVISNAKIRLAEQSEQAATNYSNALNKQKLVVATGVNSTTGATTYADATASLLMNYNAISTTEKQRLLKDTSGRLIVSNSIANAYENAETTNVGTFTTAGGAPIQDGGGQNITTANGLKAKYANVAAFLTEVLGYSTEAEATAAAKTYDAKQVTYYTNCYNGTEGYFQKFGATSNPANTNPALTYDSAALSWHQTTFSQMQANGYNAPGDTNIKSSDWLYQQLNSGNIYLEEWNTKGGLDGKGAFEGISWSSGDASLQSASDDDDANRAEAEYESTTAKIQTKDKKFDLELTNINTEHLAIQTEIDSVKKVVDKNIERSFKIFDA